MIPAKDEMDKKPDEEVKYLTCYDPATGVSQYTLLPDDLRFDQ